MYILKFITVNDNHEYSPISIATVSSNDIEELQDMFREIGMKNFLFTVFEVKDDTSIE